MELYRKDDITVSVIEEFDIDIVLDLFDVNSFNCDYETGALRPTRKQFYEIIKEGMASLSKTDCVFVLRKRNVCIGYISCFIEYDRLNMGHIAVKKEEQHKGYGKLLTSIAMMIASKENRDVSCECFHENNYLGSLGFTKFINGHYLFKGRIDSKDMPSVFMSIDDYRTMQEEKMAQEVESYRQFLKSDFMKSIF